MDRKSWSIKDEEILTDLVALMQVSDADCALLAALQPTAKALVGEMGGAFYDRLTAHAPTAEYLDGKVEHVKTKLQEWFVELFSGKYDGNYVRARLEIGKVHVRIGLPVRYPLAMMDVMLAYGRKVAAQSAQADQAASAFQKLLALDIAIFNQSYENQQLHHLAELLGNERLARRLLQK